jgi:hypothetical protein
MKKCNDFERDRGATLVARPGPSAKASRITATFGHAVSSLRSR